MQNKPFRGGPVALTATLTTNILNPPSLTGGVNVSGSVYAGSYLLIRHIRVVNKTGSPATVSLWIGASSTNAAGTEFAWQAYSVPANSFVDWYGLVRLDDTEYIVGGAGTATALTIDFEGEIGIG